MEEELIELEPTPMPTVEELLLMMHEEMEMQTEILETSARYERGGAAELADVNASLVVIVTFTVITFCWSCMRQWRKNVLGVGK